jgi:Flp pilus assembly protein CpaB
MKSKTLILMVVAIVCGLAASYMTSRLLADRNEKIPVLVAKQKIAGWTALKNPDEFFDIEEHPKNEVPKNAIGKLEAVKDFKTVKGLEKGDILVAENLVNLKTAGIEAKLKPGMRAVAVRTTQESVAGGWVMPDSHVDIIHTNRRNGDRDTESRVVLQNVLVLAVDQTDRKPDEKQGVVPATVTFEVSPEQALQLARVKDTGTIMLSLLAPGDYGPAETGTAKATPKPRPEPEPEQKPEPKPETKIVIVERPVEPKIERTTLVIHNGLHRQEVVFETKNGETRSSGADNSLAEQPSPGPAPVAPPPPPAPKENGK